MAFDIEAAARDAPQLRTTIETIEDELEPERATAGNDVALPTSWWPTVLKTLALLAVGGAAAYIQFAP